jgi:hypothetical protein
MNKEWEWIWKEAVEASLEMIRYPSMYLYRQRNGYKSHSVQPFPEMRFETG